MKTFRTLLEDLAAEDYEGVAEGLLNQETHRKGQDLDRKTERILVQKILRLPHEGLVLLLGKYALDFIKEDMEVLYGISNATGKALYYEDLLGQILDLAPGTFISERSLTRASKKAVIQLVDEALEDDQKGQDKIRPRIQGFLKRIAMVALVGLTLFSGTLVVNAEVREKVISWVVEHFEEYSVFELKSNWKRPENDRIRLDVGYLPEGMRLQDEHFSAAVITQNYINDQGEEFFLIITPSNQEISWDTENAEVQMSQIQGSEAILIYKDGSYSILFERDGYFVGMYGTIEKEEMIKIAEQISIR